MTENHDDEDDLMDDVEDGIYLRLWLILLHLNWREELGDNRKKGRVEKRILPHALSLTICLSCSQRDCRLRSIQTALVSDPRLPIDDRHNKKRIFIRISCNRDRHENHDEE